MTYKKYFEQLRKDFERTTDAYMKAKQNGIDKKTEEDFRYAKTEWENATNNCNTFLAFAKKYEINPEDEIKASNVNL
ncbi:hypothetical protein [Salibacter halophilus]|uniref:Uncharacterized protein n=1 Tax=Salibacter halophilus TaxID=1803916 RepID=A0A6N6M3H1_9FLAO|nr:hypothetical protein [Salibacter halophilus]KAB1061957.1 hypothetical protein F3059_12830 [Salibacter halophilus]